jgi:uncharacterized protein (DUF58 family)
VDERSPWRGFLSAAAVLAALLGIGSGSAALLAFAAGWGMLVALCFAAAGSGLGGLVVRRQLPASSFEAELLTVDVAIENHSARPARFVIVEDVFVAGLADRQSVFEVGPLPPMHRRVLSYRVFVARQWGLYTVGPLSIGRFDPLGLFFSRRTVPRLEPFEVYPRAVKIEGLAAMGGRSSLAARELTAAAAGQSLLFRGVREFHAGDDVRRIHWPATARRGVPMVREHERDLRPVFQLFLDLERGGRAGLGRKSTLEYLVRVATSLLWTVHRRGDSFGLLAEGEKPLFVPPALGEAHLAICLHQLLLAKQGGTRPLLELVERNRAELPHGATVALVLGTTDVDPGLLSRTIEVLRTSAAQTMVVAIDSLAFPPIDRPPTPVEVARERRTALADQLALLGVPTAIMGPERPPEEALADPRFLAPVPLHPPEAAA